MKKSLYFAMFAAVALASCSSNDTVEEIAENEIAINFDGDIQKATRAEQTEDLVTIKNTGFGVYGSKTASGTTTTLFTDEEVTWSSSKWTYTNTKYWDKTATYAFYAIAPYKASGYSCTDGKFTIDAVASGLASASDDYIIDRDGSTGISGSTYASAGTKVAFDFHHIMAKVDFKLVKASSVADADVVKVQSIKMSGWNSGSGKFVQTLTATPSTLVNTEWTIGTAGAGNVDVVTAETTLSKTASADNTNTYIMVPQNIAAETLTFTINYTINDEPFTAQVGKVADAQVWGTDSHITYTLTIGPAAIEFDVTSVCGFCVEGTGGATVN